MKNIDSFWQWIDDKREEAGISSFRKLEKMAGFAPGAIGKRKNELKPPTVEMAEGLCWALKVTWVELWTRAGFVDEINQTAVNPSSSDLTGLDAEIYQSLQGTGDDFKQAVLKTIKTWLILYQELRK